MTWLVLFDWFDSVKPCEFAVVVSIGQKTKIEKMKETQTEKQNFIALGDIEGLKDNWQTNSERWWANSGRSSLDEFEFHIGYCTDIYSRPVETGGWEGEEVGMEYKLVQIP